MFDEVARKKVYIKKILQDWNQTLMPSMKRMKTSKSKNNHDRHGIWRKYYVVGIWNDVWNLLGF